MELPIEVQQELTAIKHTHYYMRDDSILTTEEVMVILRIDTPRTLTKYIEKGLVCLNVRPRKFVMQDVRNFINQSRQSDIELQVKPLKLY